MSNLANDDDEERIAKILSPKSADKELEKLLNLRIRLKRKKPAFIRAESWRFKRLKTPWRRPKGIDNKIRLKRKGWPKSVAVGYRSPKKIRGLHPSGFEEVAVFNVKDLEKIRSHQAVRISHTVGRRKRAEIVEKAQELQIHILNKRVRPVEAY